MTPALYEMVSAGAETPIHKLYEGLRRTAMSYVRNKYPWFVSADTIVTSGHLSFFV
jgi:hypothetical protein